MKFKCIKDIVASLNVNSIGSNEIYTVLIPQVALIKL